MSRLLWLVAGWLTLVVSGASAQLPADASWRTLETAHFRVTYADGLSELARHAAAAAERAHAALGIMVAPAPRGRIDIVVTDHQDVTNGWATPLPSNRIVLLARPPVDVMELQYLGDWMETVVVHELTHIFHLDATGSVGRAVRGVFGRVPLPWPLFSAALTPDWHVEGVAVGMESALTSFGRVHGSHHEMIVRTASLEAGIDDLDRLGSSSAVWPGPARVYIYGSLFMDYLARRYGPDVTSRLVRSTAGAVLPPPLWFNRVARDAFGVSFREAYGDWSAELSARYRALSARLSAEGLTESQPLTTHDRYALHARFSPDGRSIAYARSDGRTPSGAAVIDAGTGELLWQQRQAGLHSVGWLADGAVITSDLENADRHRSYHDLYVLRRDGRTRLTRHARLNQPDVARDGRRVAAVETAGGTNRLVRLDMASGEQRALTPFDRDVNWALPRWSPDGAHLAVSRWRTGGRYDVVVLDTAGVVQLEVAMGAGLGTAPTWSPDGRWLLFSSDRTGISNLYAVAAPGVSAGPPVLRQVTNVLTGAFYPDVAPDGRSIIFSRYNDDGYRIERMPFDTAAWRTPQPALLPQLAVERGRYGAEAGSSLLQDSVRSALSRADTSVHAERAYDGAFHMRPHYWLPVVESHARETYVGVSSAGADLVDRHAWSAAVGFAPGSGRTIGTLAYTFRGLPTLRGIGLHPTLGVALRRDWDRSVTDTVVGYHVDRREDRAALILGLEHVRTRLQAGGSLAAEYERRSRYLDGPPTLRLRKPNDDLPGIAATSYLSAYVQPALAVSREDGVTLQLTARERWDRRSIAATDSTPGFDGGYREMTSHGTAYLALPFAGFARHVLAVRGSMLLRAGPGANAADIGSMDDDDDGDDDTLNGSASSLLPVRGFDAGSRSGTRAWTASAEYRFPLAIVTRSLPLRIYVDRLAGSVFVDAGHAWCGAADLARIAAACSAGATPLVSAGAELVSFTSFWGYGVPVRLGVGVPLRGTEARAARVYLAGGLAF